MDKTVAGVVWDNWGVSRRIEEARSVLTSRVLESVQNSIQDALKNGELGTENIQFDTSRTTDGKGVMTRFFYQSDVGEQDSLCTISIGLVEIDGSMQVKVGASLPNKLILGMSLSESKSKVNLWARENQEGPTPEDVKREEDSRNGLAMRLIRAPVCGSGTPPVDNFVAEVMDVFIAFCMIPKWFASLYTATHTVIDDEVLTDEA